MAAELFNALTIGPAAEEYGVPEKTCVIIEARALSRRFAREFRCKNLAFRTLLNKLAWKIQERERWQRKSLWIAPAIPDTI